MILVTGATGFIGSHLVERLVSEGKPVRALLRRTSPLRSLSGVEVAYGDLVSGDGLVQAVSGVDAVIHLAGAIKALHARDYYAANVQGTENLVRAAAGRGIRFVHVSSLAAAGPSPDGQPIGEDAQPRPLTEYGKSKLEGERRLRALAPDAVIVRPPVVYGPRDPAVLQVLKPISQGWALEIAGGERWFSAIYVRDLVEGLMAAARCPAAAGRTYFLTHPLPVSWSHLVITVARITGRRPRVVRIPGAAARALGFCAEIWGRARGKPSILSREKVAEAQCTAWLCDWRRAAAELGFEAATNLEKGMAETLAWYKEAGWLRY